MAYVFGLVQEVFDKPLVSISGLQTWETRRNKNEGLLVVLSGAGAAMLVYVFGRMYYSAEAVWATSAFVAASLPVGVWLLRLEQCLLDEQWLAVLDWALAAMLLNGVLWPFLQFNLTPGGRADLYGLRATSALLASAALVALCVHSFSRMQLALLNAFYLGLTLNLASWSSALWLRMQPSGLAGLLLSDRVLQMVRTRPLVQWLREPLFQVSLLKLRQIVPLLLVPDEHLQTALSALPPGLRRKLRQPILVRAAPPLPPRGYPRDCLRKSVSTLVATALRARALAPMSQAEVPQTVREVLQPWAEGPGHLCVRKVGLVSCHTASGVLAAPATLARSQAPSHLVAPSPACSPRGPGPRMFRTANLVTQRRRRAQDPSAPAAAADAARPAARRGCGCRPRVGLRVRSAAPLAQAHEHLGCWRREATPWPHVVVPAVANRQRRAANAACLEAALHPPLPRQAPMHPAPLSLAASATVRLPQADGTAGPTRDSLLSLDAPREAACRRRLSRPLPRHAHGAPRRHAAAG